ncbi:hypothetical protein [Methyloceanibacter sp.]|uniref:hypothetical protein n=1 Tax=Methyloceanibacter sp. TaxID=1965321 RepID=UPI003D6D19D8
MRTVWAILFEDRPEVALFKDWLEVPAPGPALALASRVQVPQVQVPQVPVEQPLAPVLAARLLALVPAQVLVPEEASALVRGPEPGLQPSVARARVRGPRLCAHT